MPIGDIGDVLDTHIFEATRGLYPAPWTIDGTLCCVIYAAASDYAWARSFNVDALGQITEPASNTLQLTDFGTSHHRGPLRLDDVVCPVFRHAAPAAGDLEGVIVNADGTLSQHANHECGIINDTTEWHQAILRPDGVVVAIHNHSAGVIFVSTATVAADGEVAGPVSNFHHTLFLSTYPSIAYSTGNVLLTTYTDPSQYLRAKSVSVTDAGVASSTGQSEVIVTDYITSSHMAIKMRDNKFVVAHTGPASVGRVLALSMTDAGAITVPTNYYHTFDASAGDRPFIIRLSDEVFACVYTGAGPVGVLKTFKVEIGAAVTWTELDSHTFTGVQMNWPQIIALGNDIAVIAYHDENSHGQLTTIELDTRGIVSGHTEMLMGIGP